MALHQFKEGDYVHYVGEQSEDKQKIWIIDGMEDEDVVLKAEDEEDDAWEYTSVDQLAPAQGGQAEVNIGEEVPLEGVTTLTGTVSKVQKGGGLVEVMTLDKLKQKDLMRSKVQDNNMLPRLNKQEVKLTTDNVEDSSNTTKGVLFTDV